MFPRKNKKNQRVHRTSFLITFQLNTSSFFFVLFPVNSPREAKSYLNCGECFISRNKQDKEEGVMRFVLAGWLAMVMALVGPLSSFPPVSRWNFNLNTLLCGEREAFLLSKLITRPSLEYRMDVALQVIADVGWGVVLSQISWHERSMNLFQFYSFYETSGDPNLFMYVL